MDGDKCSCGNGLLRESRFHKLPLQKAQLLSGSRLTLKGFAVSYHNYSFNSFGSDYGIKKFNIKAKLKDKRGESKSSVQDIKGEALLDDPLVDEENVPLEELGDNIHFLIANFIRGGLFGKK